MAKKNVTLTDFAGVTFNKYSLQCTYVENGETLYGLMPVNVKYEEYPILLVSKSGENLLLDKSQIDFGEHPEFAWASEKYQKLREDIKQLDSLPNAEGSIWKLFKSQGGFLALCEDGDVFDIAKSLNGERNFPTEHHTEGGATHPSFPIISVNGAMNYSADRVLLHELTHNACLTLIDYAQSDLFKAVVEVERANHSSNILSKVDGAIALQTSQGGYTEQQNYDELIARIHEKRLQDPEEFKKQLPVLDCFFKNYLYPSVLAHVDGYSNAENFFKCKITQTGVKDNLSQLYEQAHERVVEQKKIDLKVYNILMPINKYGYHQSDPTAKASPAYHQVYQEQQAYQQESQAKMQPLSKNLISFMKFTNLRAEMRAKLDKRDFSAYLQQCNEVNSKPKSQEKSKQLQTIEYEDLNRPDQVKNAWHNYPEFVDYVRKHR